VPSRDTDGVFNATINRVLEVAQRFCRLAHEDWGVNHPGAPDPDAPEPGRWIRYLTREEAERLIGAYPKQMKPVAQYALAAGYRMSEFPGLEWRRMDLERRVALRLAPLYVAFTAASRAPADAIISSNSGAAPKIIAAVLA